VKSIFSKGENESMVIREGSSANKELGGEPILDSDEDDGEQKKSSLEGEDSNGVSANKFAMLLGRTSRSMPKGSTGAKNSEVLACMVSIMWIALVVE